MFLFELTLALGFASPRHLLAKLTSEEVTYWLEFYKVRTFGFVRDSLLFGTLASQQHNMNRKPNTRAVSWRDFFPIDAGKDGEGRDSSETIIALFRQYNAERGYR